jgi:anti-sigma B factor antagonist
LTQAVEHRDLDGSTSVIAVRGALILGPTGKQIEALVTQLLSAGRHNLVFDLSGVTHIDSTGLGCFIDAHSRLERVGGQMRLAGAGGLVRDTFHVTRLDTVFRFYPTLEAACEGLTRPPPAD